MQQEQMTVDGFEISVGKNGDHVMFHARENNHVVTFGWRGDEFVGVTVAGGVADADQLKPIHQPSEALRQAMDKAHAIYKNRSADEQ